MNTKKLMLICGLSFSTVLVIAQNEDYKKMPPSNILPKVGEKKTLYQLPKVCDYEVFDSTGTQVNKGNGEFIDVTLFPKGRYFFKYLEKTEIYFKED